MSVDRRADHEIAHGQWLSERDAESVWGWGSPAGQARARRRADLIAAGAQLRAGVNALEIGCGTGLFTQLLSGTGASIVAVDISEELLARARALRLPADRVRFECARFEDMALPGGFDAAIGSSVLHHLEIDEALVAIRQLLKPGGLLSFAEPNMLNPQVFLERHPPFFMKDYYAYISPDETAFVRFSFKRLLEQAGFEQVVITPFDWLHPATPAALIPVVRAAEPLVERIPGLREFSGSMHIQARTPRA
jgi:2-polyprenyl-3-methyl-5-hydroxy-6-metoxy-1,4-benzoquinol methylase